VVKAALPANYGIYWVIQKVGSSNIYQKLTQTNAQGDLLINKSDLPSGFLEKGSNIKIQLKNGSNYLQPITFVFGSKNYSCALAKLSNFKKDVGDTSGVNVIQFTDAVIPQNNSSTSNDSIVVPFVNQTSITYNHNLGRVVDVTIYDLSGNLIIATVTEDTVNHNFITVSFTSSTSGRLLID
jgi:hypothetical protein